jgi:hypothetical protein
VESDVSKAEENGFFSVFENQTNEATADASTRTRASRAMTTSSSSPRAARASAAIAARDPALPDTEKVASSPPAAARVPPVGGLAASRDNDDAPVNDLLGSAPSCAVATDSDNAVVWSSSKDTNTPASSSCAPLETHRGPRPARGFSPETASSRKETVAVAPATAAFEDASADSGAEETDTDAETPVAMSPDTSLLLGGPDDARGPGAGGAGDDAKALERRVTGSPDSVLGDSSRFAFFFDSDSSADEAEVDASLGSASSLFPDAEAVDDDAIDREASASVAAEEDDATLFDNQTKPKSVRRVSFAEYSKWSVHDIGSCRDLSREKQHLARGAGWLANPSGIGLGWLKQKLAVLSVFAGGGMGVNKPSSAGKKCLLKRALRESRRNMRENVEYNVAYAEAVDGLSRAAEREAKARRQRERRRRQTVRW